MYIYFKTIIVVKQLKWFIYYVLKSTVNVSATLNFIIVKMLLSLLAFTKSADYPSVDQVNAPLSSSEELPIKSLLTKELVFVCCLLVFSEYSCNSFEFIWVSFEFFWLSSGSWNDPFRNWRSTSFGVGLPRTACAFVCILSVSAGKKSTIIVNRSTTKYSTTLCFENEVTKSYARETCLASFPCLPNLHTHLRLRR